METNVNIEDLLSEARISASKYEFKACACKAALAMRLDPDRVEALRLYGQHADSRSKRLESLRRASELLMNFSYQCERAEEIVDEVTLVPVALAQELATGDEDEILEAIGIMEVIATEKDGDFSPVEAACLIARWCAEIEQWARGMPFACMAGLSDALEGMYWGAVYLAEDGRDRATEMLERAVPLNKYVPVLLTGDMQPKPRSDTFRAGSLEEAEHIVASLWKGWRNGEDRMDDLLEEVACLEQMDL